MTTTVADLQPGQWALIEGLEDRGWMRLADDQTLHVPRRRWLATEEGKTFTAPRITKCELAGEEASGAVEAEQAADDDAVMTDKTNVCIEIKLWDYPTPERPWQAHVDPIIATLRLDGMLAPSPSLLAKLNEILAGKMPELRAAIAKDDETSASADKEPSE